jgi:peptidyl-prolyl cis-trans isomerase SurA
LRKIYLIILLTLPISINAKLIDKTIAVIDKDIITLSDAERIKINIKARQNISPQIYNKKNYKISTIVDSFIRSQIIRKNLKQLGFVISNSQVESQIKQTQSNLQVNREELLQFLSSNNITFDEYFLITKETIEFNIFLARIIKPLIKITDYELKNEFSKNTKLSSNTFNYTLVDFYVKKSSIPKSKIKSMRSDLIAFKKDGILPTYLKNLETNVLTDVKEDGLSLDIRKSLSTKTIEEFSNPVEINEYFHLFFIKKKSIVESEKFSNTKRELEQKIFLAKSENVINKWIDQEKTKFYIKKYL